jgi:Flp pilus assembly protein TadG
MSAPVKSGRDFVRDTRGAIAILFVFFLVIFIFCGGMAIDFGRAMQASAVVRSALDGASLMAAKAMVEQQLDDGALTQMIKTNIESQLRQSGLPESQWRDLEVTTDRDKGLVEISMNVSVPTTLTRVMRFETIDSTQTARSLYKIKKAEVALVLDITGSMCEPDPPPCNTAPKLDALKDAAKAAINDFLPADKPPINKVSIVPYAASVNAGDVADAVSNNKSLDNCVVERDGAEASTDSDPTVPNELKVQADTPPGPNLSLAAPYDMNVYSCPGSEVLPLTDDRVKLEDSIDGLTADGGTAGHIGIGWGWYTISPEWSGIFGGNSAPKDYADTDTMKSVILMTDGDFNVSYFNGALNATSQAQALALCDAIKAKNIKIYTVGFEIDKLPPPRDTIALNLLTDCASSDGGGGKNFYNANGGLALTAAFKDIAGKIQALRLSQ